MSERRATIADGLAECPPGGWVAVDEFCRYMQATGNNLVVARDAWGLYIGEQQYGSLGYDGNERVLNTRYLLSLLHEYAATLGMIDLAVIPPAGARDDYHSLWERTNPRFSAATTA